MFKRTGPIGPWSCSRATKPILAPDPIVAEVCNAAWKSLRRAELSPAQFDAIVTEVAQPFSRLIPVERLIRPAAALTRRLDHPVYDCLYLALADTEGLRFVTADQQLVAVVSGTSPAGQVMRL